MRKLLITVFLLLIPTYFLGLSHAYVATSINKSTGAITANGSFFYPKIIWNCGAESMKEVAANGFNVVLDMWAGYSGDVNRTLTMLDACSNAGIFGICGIGRNLVRDIAKLSSYINGIKNHEALFAITFPDEGTTSYEELGVGNTKEEMLAAYNKIKEIAPNLLVIFDHYKEDNGVTWGDIGDVVDAFGIDYYPFVIDPGWNSFHSWQGIMKTLQTDTLAGDNCKAIWQFAQGSSSGSYQRIPTYRDMALEFWASVSYFAKGAYQIYGWGISSDGMQTNTDVRNDAYNLIKNDVIPNQEWLARSLKADNSLTLSAKTNSDLLTGSNPYVSSICLAHEDRVYFVIVNGHFSKACGSVSVILSGVQDQVATIIADSSGGDAPTIKDGLFSVGDLEPFGYRVLKFNLDTAKQEVKPPANLRLSISTP
ncbi:hypothetical protein [Desulfoferrobacter suflitae]|uniref:hypothetical protein n=1 Tax=Desulfoferrobacter suflitae TaxID=2865782 RepID=UPI0021648C49|nr:hypothetical protein [Desulfoferrobacter suflitae]MCK8603313.1 hypothetical protein [Desulfoferrobacter suflitae]